jgi:hypothetical protein
MKRLGIAIVAAGIASFAHAADLPTTKAPDKVKPNCWASVWDWLNTSAADCPIGASWIPERSATCLREADLNVLSELGNQGLEWRLEPEAFTRGEVRREDDLLDILVGCDIQVAWQPST